MIASATEEQALVAREVDRNLVGIRNLSQQVLQGALHTETAGHDLAGMAGNCIRRWRGLRFRWCGDAFLR